MSEHLVSDGYKLDERDAMAWQVFVSVLSNSGGPIQANGMTGWGMTNCKEHHVAEFAYGAADAFLAERKRQQGEA